MVALNDPDQEYPPPQNPLAKGTLGLVLYLAPKHQKSHRADCEQKNLTNYSKFFKNIYLKETK
jgi:hypothetical protein